MMHRLAKCIIASNFALVIWAAFLKKRAFPRDARKLIVERFEKFPLFLYVRMGVYCYRVIWCLLCAFNGSMWSPNSFHFPKMRIEWAAENGYLSESPWQWFQRTSLFRLCSCNYLNSYRLLFLLIFDANFIYSLFAQSIRFYVTIGRRPIFWRIRSALSMTCSM